VHFVNLVGSHLQVDPCGQFPSAKVELVKEVSDVIAINPAASKYDVRYIEPPFSSHKKAYYRTSELSLASGRYFGSELGIHRPTDDAHKRLSRGPC
jgi:hypothetical protein